MIYKIAVCDDDKVYAEKINSVIQGCCEQTRTRATVDIFCESGPLLDLVESGRCYDIYVLDIEMPKYDGMDIAGKIKEILPKTIVIFVTAYDQFAVKGYELDIFRYIPKRDMEKRLAAALRDAFYWHSLQSGKHYIISNNRRFEKISYHDISYVYKEQKNSVFVTTGALKAPVRKTLSEVYAELNSEEFVFIDRCYIINLSNVERITDRHVFLAGGQSLVIGAGHLARLKKQIGVFWEGKI